MTALDDPGACEGRDGRHEPAGPHEPADRHEPAGPREPADRHERDARGVSGAQDGRDAPGDARDAGESRDPRAAGEADAAAVRGADADAVPDRPARPRLPRWTRLPRRTVAWAAAWTAAVVLAAVAGWSYASVRGDDALHYGKQRDAVLAAGQRDIARLTTADAGHADRDLGRWLAATTGPLHDRLAGTRASDASTLKASGTSATGTVTDAAVTELDTRAGTARLIATVQVRLQPKSGRATTDRKRFEADLARDGGTWKLAALTAVPLGSS